MKFERVSEKVLRGEHPLELADFAALQAVGVTQILNLERGWFEFFHNRLNAEFDIAAGLGIKVIHLQLGDIFPPSEDDFRALVDIELEDGGQIYVHCLHGVDRTGMAIAIYRVVAQKWSADAAIEEMYAKGFHRWAYWWWVPKLEKFLKKIATN